MGGITCGPSLLACLEPYTSNPLESIRKSRLSPQKQTVLQLCQSKARSDQGPRYQVFLVRLSGLRVEGVGFGAGGVGLKG